jgi:hypothetical protein
MSKASRRRKERLERRAREPEAQRESNRQLAAYRESHQKTPDVLIAGAALRRAQATSKPIPSGPQVAPGSGNDEWRDAK